MSTKPFTSLTRRAFLASAPLGAALPAKSGLAQAPGDPLLLEARALQIPILPAPGPETAGAGFGEPRGEPVLRLKRDVPTRLRIVNKLNEPLALHWQGMRLPNAQDGAAPLTGPALAPGAGADLTIRPPDAGLFWLRPQAMPHAPRQLDLGLSGLVIVDEASPPEIDREIVATLDDWSLGADGLIRAPLPHEVSHAGGIGDLVTVNARPAPERHALPPGARVRLRLVNASNARIMILAFAGVTPKVVAIDGQNCDAFEPVRNAIPAGPGARFDLIFDMPPEPGAEASMILRGATPPGAPHLPDQPLMVWTAEGDPLRPRDPIESLPENPALPAAIRLQSARRMDLVIEGGARLEPGAGMAMAMGWRAGEALPEAGANWTINGKPGAMNGAPLFSVRRGTPVSLGFVNRTSFPQAIHVHGHAMRVLHLMDDGWEPYWRDTVLVAEGRTSRVAFVADNPGRWLIASQVMERQAAGLYGWFEVT